MVESAASVRTWPRAALAGALLALVLSGCSEMSDSWTTAFADPSRYVLYDCKQLEPERKALALKEAELQGLMAKAQTGAAGAVVSELAYRNDYVAVRGQARLLEDAWRKNNCHETPATAATATSTQPASKLKPAPPSRSGSAVY